MPTIGASYPTYLDVAKRTDPTGQIAAIVEIMSQTNPMIVDGMALEGNLTTGHRSTQRTGLPEATWRLLNQGVSPSKSTTVQVDDTCGSLEAYAEVDKALAALNGNSEEWRLSEDMAFLEKMSQTMEATTFYGDTTANPEQFLGLKPRYDALGTDSTVSTYNVIDGGQDTAGKGTSIWMVTWGPNATHYIYPKGTAGGYERNFLGEWTLQDRDQKNFQGYRTHYKWAVGLCVRDWRSTVRIANVPTADSVASGETLTAEYAFDQYLAMARHRMKKTGGRTVLYMNRDTMTWLDIRAQTKDNVYLTRGEWGGQDVLFWRDVPLRVTDGITNTEAVVS
jgi:hypothetical protein